LLIASAFAAHAFIKKCKLINEGCPLKQTISSTLSDGDASVIADGHKATAMQKLKHHTGIDDFDEIGFGIFAFLVAMMVILIQIRLH